MSTTEEGTRVSNRRNLYVRNEDLEVWEKAERMAGDLSPLVSRLLRQYVEQREAATDRIVVEVEDREGNRSRKAFKGRMLVRGFQPDEPGALAGWEYFAAQGAKGGLALWAEKDLDGMTDSFHPYDSFAEAESAGWPPSFLSAISSALGEEWVEEIDL